MARRVVVVVPPAGGDPELLPGAVATTRQWISGGARTLHELAVAAAATGREVELRGTVDVRLVDELRRATGAAVRLPADPRPPQATDTVLLADGGLEPRALGHAWLSPATVVLVVLAPLGMFGWPFAGPWRFVDPVSLDPADVHLPESLRAVTGMGIPVWSCGEGIVGPFTLAGGSGRWLGAGLPWPFPEPSARTADVAWLQDNRWADRSRAVVAGLPARIDAIATAPQGEVVRRLGAARLFLHPAGVEGEPRITREARAMGAVPIVLAGGNPFAHRVTEAEGVFAVPTVEEMPTAIRRLLADPDRLAELSARAMRTARAEVAWEPYVARVDAAFEGLGELGELGGDPVADPARVARSAIGAALRAELRVTAGAVDRVRELDRERAELVGRLRDVERDRDVTAARYLELVGLFHTALARAESIEAELTAGRPATAAPTARRGSGVAHLARAVSGVIRSSPRG